MHRLWLVTLSFATTLLEGSQALLHRRGIIKAEAKKEQKKTMIDLIHSDDDYDGDDYYDMTMTT